MGTMSWDCIVIGAGSAGCALAHQLVTSGQRVLVLEAGGSDRSPLIKIPAMVLRAGAKHDWGYRSQPDFSRNGAKENWTRGRVLGGSSSINGTMYVRGAAADFERLNLPGWSADEVMPVFREMECSDQPSLYRGHTGPQYVRSVRRPHPITKAFVESAVAAGYPFNDDYNGSCQEGVSYAQLSQRRGLRCSAADAFLRPHLGERNLKLLLNAFVEKLSVARGRAVSVSYIHHGNRHSASASNIVLCAGALNSPKLLMLSGIGDAQELARHRITVEHDLPGVGRNLKEHPLITLVFRSRIPTHIVTRGALQGLGIAAEFLLHGEGPISNLFEGAAFVRSSPSLPTPDLQIVFMTRGATAAADGSFRFTPFPSVALHIIESYPLSTGRIRLASNDPHDAPIIECRLLEEPADVDTLAKGMLIARRIMRTHPIGALIDSEITPGADVQSLTSIQEFIRQRAGISFHPIGTCQMGSGADAVVDPNLRVHGIENLWIADASIFPRPLSANMNAPCMMIGTKLGKHLVAGTNTARTVSSADRVGAVRKKSACFSQAGFGHS